MARGFNIPDDETLKFNEPVPYHVRVDRQLLDVTRQKLALARYPEEQTDFGTDDWSQGAKVNRVRELAEYWRDSFDWDKQEAWLNETFNHYFVKLDIPGYGPLTLHYTHARSTDPRAIPLLFSHGWPGSFVEAAKIVGRLTQGSPDGGVGFHVVAPSIPGFGLSPGPTRSGIGPEVTARAFKMLMTDVLGYGRFVTQGGDFGAIITRSIAIQHPEAVAAQHLNMFPVAPPTLLRAPRAYVRWCLSSLLYSDLEHEARRARDYFQREQSGYYEEQRTRAQTLGFALGDSPLGLLAWVVEKIHEWGHVDEAFTADYIITLVMMHWIQGATPGLRFYREAFGARHEADKAFSTYVSVPTGVSRFIKEPLHCPEDWAQQVANIQFWKEYNVGGHFPSLECPEILESDVRSFFSTVRESFAV